MSVREVPIDDIRIDGGTQIRERIDEDTVAEYASRVQDGNDFPACIIFHDGSDHWLADGFHRVMAHKRAGKEAILCDVRKGTKRDALFYALGANKFHGLPLGRGDKKRAVLLMLQEWGKCSQTEIAKHVGVSQPFVSQVAASYKDLLDRPTTTATTRNGKTYEMKTANIGRTPVAAAVGLRDIDTDDAPPVDREPVEEDPFADPKPKRTKDPVVTCKYCGENRPNDPGRCPLCNDTPKAKPAVVRVQRERLEHIRKLAASLLQKLNKSWSQLSPVELREAAQALADYVEQTVERAEG